MALKVLIALILLLVAFGLLALAFKLITDAIRAGFWQTETNIYEATLEVKIED